MTERIPQSPPLILPVTDKNRPLWSVMIPAYNCINYLPKTLESVLSQDPGPELMQIEVVDDHSTDGDVETLVRQIGGGRINYYRQPQNMGSLRNFETCINRSRGHYIHLLHGDDMLKPGFYKTIEDLFQRYPDIGSAFCRNSFINSIEQEIALPRLLQQEEGIIDNWLEKIAVYNYPQPPAVVVKRSVYEDLGSFFAVHYGEDWEMWCRIASKYPVAYTPEIRAMYRIHSSNITNSSYITGQSIRDINKVINIIQDYLPEGKRDLMKKTARRGFAIMFAEEAFSYFHENRKQYLALSWQAFLMDKNLQTLYYVLRLGKIYLRFTYLPHGIRKKVRNFFSKG